MRRLLRWGLVLIIPLGLALSGIISGQSAPHADKPNPPQETAQPSADPSAGAAQSSQMTVASSSQAPAGVSCPTDWAYFDNQRLHYSICYPQGWGFADNAPQTTPASALSLQSLYGLRLMSNQAFPWPANASAIDRVRGASATELELLILQQGVSFSRSCTPSQPVAISGSTGKSCEYRFDMGGAGFPSDDIRSSSQGAFYGLLVTIPLKQTPLQETPGDNLTGAQLLISVVQLNSSDHSPSSTLWRLITLVRPY